MDRQEWLAARRAAVAAAYDSLAATYDEHEYPADAQREWIGRLLGLSPAGGTVLDATADQAQIGQAFQIRRVRPGRHSHRPGRRVLRRRPQARC